jgi:hypothetical protein
MPEIVDLYVIFEFLFSIAFILALLYGLYLFKKKFGWGDMLWLLIGLSFIGRLGRWISENYWY